MYRERGGRSHRLRTVVVAVVVVVVVVVVVGVGWRCFMIGLLSAIGRGLRMIADLIGRPFREWAEWAERNPGAAAQQLEAAAVVLSYRAGAYKRQQGWRARRDRALAHAFKEHASKLREDSFFAKAQAHTLESACRKAMESA